MGLHFDIHFNNPMNTQVNPTVTAHYFSGNKSGGNFVNWSNQHWEDNQTFGFDADATLANDTYAGYSVALSITGAVDAQHKGSDAAMDGDPKTIAYTVNGKEWHGFEGVIDHYHIFQLGTPFPTATPTGTITPAATQQTPGPSRAYGHPGFTYIKSVGHDSTGDLFVEGTVNPGLKEDLVEKWSKGVPQWSVYGGAPYDTVAMAVSPGGKVALMRQPNPLPGQPDFCTQGFLVDGNAVTHTYPSLQITGPSGPAFVACLFDLLISRAQSCGANNCDPAFPKPGRRERRNGR
jgi:hypothetical protein